LPSLADLLARASDERERSRDMVGTGPPRGPGAEAPGTAPFLVGCLLRLGLFVFLLVALAILALFVLLGR
jgi:hypothetical protein